MVTIAKIVQNILETTNSSCYFLGPDFGYLTRSTVILKLNSFKRFNQAKFYDLQNFCQGMVVVIIFWTAQSLTLY